MFLTRRTFFLALAVLAGFGFTCGAAPAATYLTGIDVSNWQGAVDWTKVKNSGRTFAFCKATEGTGFTDAQFATNWANMKKVGLIRGAYHFGRPGSDAVTQARFFVKTVKPQKGDLQLVLDLEVTDGKSPAQVWAWTQSFLAEVKRLTGRPGIIYTGYYFWRDKVGNPTNNLNCPLWIAAYGVSAPLVPRAWSTWTFWQYSSTGTVPGVKGNCDLDYFNGSLTQLQKLTLP
jgi:lysozyme